MVYASIRKPAATAAWMRTARMGLAGICGCGCGGLSGSVISRGLQLVVSVSWKE